MNKLYYAPKLPLEINNDENFIYLKDAQENAKQKLKMIVLTNKGEKIYDPDFGLGIRKYLFEQSSGLVTVSLSENDEEKIFASDDFEGYLTKELNRQVDKYSPDIEIKNTTVQVKNDVIYLGITFSYRGFIEDNLLIAVTE